MPPALSIAEEKDLVQWIRKEHSKGSPRTQEQILQYVKDNYDIIVHQSWASRFLNRYPEAKKYLASARWSLTPDEEQTLAEKIRHMSTAEGKYMTIAQMQDYIQKSFNKTLSERCIVRFRQRQSLQCTRNDKRHITDKKCDHCQQKITYTSNSGNEGPKINDEIQEMLQQKRCDNSPATKLDNGYADSIGGGCMEDDLDPVTQDARRYLECLMS